jgi:hypothetical protein
MPSRSRTRAFAIATLTALALVGGCAATIAGTPAVDGSAALSSAFSSAATAVTNSSIRLPTSMSFNLPAPPSPTIASTVSTPSPAPPSSSTEGSPTRDTTAPKTTAATNGVDVDAIVIKLAANPLYADATATKAADAAALAALGQQVAAARSGGFPVTVVLIGHEVEDLTTVTDAIAKRTNGTSIAVSPSHFAVSSKAFSAAQLKNAEDAASSAANPVEAASKLITALQGQRSSTTSIASTNKPTKSTSKPTATTGGGSLETWDRFQLPDGSIACMIDSDTVRCDVAQHTYTPPKNPNPACEGDYGDAVMMSGSKAPTFICISDTVADPSLPKLTNGSTTQVGDIMCFSDPPSVTCLSLASAHGFVLQPDLYQFY